MTRPANDRAFENAGAAPDVSVRIQLLGGFAVRVGNQVIPESAWRLNKARTLVKVLALAPNHRLPREQVLDLLWPDLPMDSAGNNLYQTLHAARRALRTDDGVVEIRLQHGVLALHPDGKPEVDVDVFERSAAAARRSDDPAGYHEALAQYAGDLLPDDRYEDWAAWRREGLRSTYLALLVEAARRHEARGELKAAINTLQTVVAAEPLNEEAAISLVQLYAATGQRASAIRQYTVLEEALRTELDVEPDEASKRTYEAILARRFDEFEAGEPGVSADNAPRHNLPIALTSFVGRADVIASLKGQLGHTRLLTLSGVAGAGKTRLALQLAWSAVEAFRDGVWLVSLAAIADPHLVPRAVASALQVPEKTDASWTEALVAHLKSRETLIVLDNCEHVVETCGPLIRRLLSTCPGVRILATSRVRLGVAGELVEAVPPLEIPGPKMATVDALRTVEAVRLFVDRARFRQPTFSLTTQTAAAISRICQKVEGIPLAVELAAARIGALSVAQIAAYLDNAPRLLTTGSSEETRHHTLRAALDWSYELLVAEDQHLFRHLAVFEGGWTLETISAVTAANDDPLAALDGLTRLVDASLVIAEAAGTEDVRYRLLEPVRQYALELLADRGEDGAARRGHAQLFAALAQDAALALRSPDARHSLDRLEREHGNLRAAIRFSASTGESAALALDTAGSLWRFWVMRGHIQEGRALLADLLRRYGEDDSVPVLARASAHNAAGALAFYQSDEADALDRYRSALELRRKARDEDGIASSLSNVALVLKNQGNVDEARKLLQEARELQARTGNLRGLASTVGNLGIIEQEFGFLDRAQPLLEESLALARKIGGPLGSLTSLNNLAAVMLERGEYDRARVMLEEGLTLGRELNSRRSLFVTCVNLGHLERRLGNHAAAWPHYREALALSSEQGETMAVASVIEGIGALLVATERVADGVELFAAAHALRARANTPEVPVDRAHYIPVREKAREELGDRFDEIWKAGLRNDPDAVIRRLVSTGTYT